MNTVPMAVSYAVMFVLGAPFWVYAVICISKRKPFLPHTDRLESPLGLVDVGILFSSWVFGQLIAIPVATLQGIDVSQPIQENADRLQLLPTMILCQIAGLFIGLLIVAYKYGHAPRIFGLQPENVVRDLRLSAIAFVMVVPPLLLLQGLLAQLVEYDHQTLTLTQSASTAGLFWLWMSAAVMAPITEEIFFRGIFQGWMQRFPVFNPAEFPLSLAGGWSATQDSETPSRTFPPSKPPTMDLPKMRRESRGQKRKMGPLKHPRAMGPIVISSLLFASVHLGQGAAPIPLFFFGMALGYLYRQTGSILPCIGLHFLLNAYSMFWATYPTG